MRAPLKRHAGENGEAARYSFSVELIIALIVVLGGGSVAGGYVTFGGIGERQVERAVSSIAEEQKEFIKEVIREEESTFTLDELREHGAKQEEERLKEEHIQGQITSIESDVTKLKTDVSDISSVQKSMARDVEKLVRAIPDP